MILDNLRLQDTENVAAQLIYRMSFVATSITMHHNPKLCKTQLTVDVFLSKLILDFK